MIILVGRVGGRLLENELALGASMVFDRCDTTTHGLLPQSTIVSVSGKDMPNRRQHNEVSWCEIG